ncbi:MAG: hypothetical protein KGL39_53100 [Patescibacteria group bacterium]|nr:hypothetical protein [Patescibacteria group bacterium]
MVAQTEQPESPKTEDAKKFAALRESAARRPRRKRVGRPLSPNNRLVFIKDLIASGYGSERTIWRMVADGELPKPFKYGVKAAWREANIARRLDKKQPILPKAR